ncbi:GntR family transcriptional regulator [Bacillaceae bacterium Marseille-Q3522]|nr:GntR family transcriptional regulator [Bacillaceae bacterium Marseille-Q3522]
MRVNKNLPTPLYHQVKDYFEEKITAEEWEPGYQLPSEKELAVQFKVSTITIKRAIQDLVNKGILYRQRGKGTFVSRKEEKDISQMVTLRNDAVHAQLHPHKTLSFQKTEAGVTIAKKLQINENDEVFKIHRLKMEDQTPVVMEYTYVPSRLFPDLSQAYLENDLFYNIFINKYGVKLGKAKIYFSTIIADEYEANLLHIPIGEQLFVLERFTFSEEKQAIEYSKFIIRQEKSKYFIEVIL